MWSRLRWRCWRRRRWRRPCAEWRAGTRAWSYTRQPIGCGQQDAVAKGAGGLTAAVRRPGSVWRCCSRKPRSAAAWPRTGTSVPGSCRLTCARLRPGLRLARSSATSWWTAGAWSRPDSRSSGRPSCDDLPYHLKAVLAPAAIRPEQRTSVARDPSRILHPELRSVKLPLPLSATCQEGIGGSSSEVGLTSTEGAGRIASSRPHYLVSVPQLVAVLVGEVHRDLAGGRDVELRHLIQGQC
jgi:hypothetical protein